MSGHHIVRLMTVIALPVVPGSQTMTDFVGKSYDWIGRKGTPIETHDAGVPREIAVPEPGLAVSYCSFDIILADPTPFSHPLVTDSSYVDESRCD